MKYFRSFVLLVLLLLVVACGGDDEDDNGNGGDSAEDGRVPDVELLELEQTLVVEEYDGHRITIDYPAGFAADSGAPPSDFVGPWFGQPQIASSPELMNAILDEADEPSLGEDDLWMWISTNGLQTSDLEGAIQNLAEESAGDDSVVESGVVNLEGKAFGYLRAMPSSDAEGEAPVQVYLYPMPEDDDVYFLLVFTSGNLDNFEQEMLSIVASFNAEPLPDEE
jgi:hypothetical protein